jgi:hypothetical protein
LRERLRHGKPVPRTRLLSLLARAELGGYAAAHKLKIDIQVRIVHEREVNKARYCPQNKTLIGAWPGLRGADNASRGKRCPFGVRYTQRGERGAP